MTPKNPFQPKLAVINFWFSGVVAGLCAGHMLAWGPTTLPAILIPAMLFAALCALRRISRAIEWDVKQGLKEMMEATGLTREPTLDESA